MYTWQLGIVEGVHCLQRPSDIGETVGDKGSGGKYRPLGVASTVRQVQRKAQAHASAVGRDQVDGEEQRSIVGAREEPQQQTRDNDRELTGKHDGSAVTSGVGSHEGDDQLGRSDHNTRGGREEQRVEGVKPESYVQISLVSRRHW